MSFAIISGSHGIIHVGPLSRTRLQQVRVERRMTLYDLAVALDITFGAALELELASDTLSARETLDLIRRIDDYASSRTFCVLPNPEYRCTCPAWCKTGSCDHMQFVVYMEGKG